MNKPIIFLLFFLLIFFSFVSGIDVKVIKKPKPTCFEKKELYKPLKMHNMISGEDDEDENFLGEGINVTADSEGNVYVFDRVFCEVFKYDKDLNFKKRFGRMGKGPGEFATNRFSGGVNLNIGGSNRLYAQDYMNRRLTVFKLNGDYITDYKISFKHSFLPQVDKEGNFYMPSVNGGVIDVFNSKMELIGVILDDIEFRNFLFYEPNYSFKKFYCFPDSGNFKYYLSKEDMLLVYIINSSTLYILKNRKLIRKFSIWPEKILKAHKKDLYATYEKYDDAFVSFCVDFFIDEDDDNYFYIQFGIDKRNNIVPVYKFDLRGNLKKILYITRTEGFITLFKLKKNNFFYTVKDGSIILYKE